MTQSNEQDLRSEQGKKPYSVISTDELKARLDREGADNQSRRSGFAFVNVLPQESFAAEHIPDSVNIPMKQLEAFERLFDKEKEVVVYCASKACDASEHAASELVRRGFRSVYEYQAGTEGWRNAGNKTMKDQIEH